MRSQLRRPGEANTLSLRSSPALDVLLAGLHLLARIALGVLVLGLLAAHLDVAAAGRALVALLGGIVAAALVAFGVVAGFLRLVVDRVLGRREVEILEQPPRQLGEGRLVVERQCERVELGRGLLLDPRRDELEARTRRRAAALRRSAARAR